MVGCQTSTCQQRQRALDWKVNADLNRAVVGYFNRQKRLWFSHPQGRLDLSRSAAYSTEERRSCNEGHGQTMGDQQ